MFKQTVLQIISAIPAGKVMSYGQVAAAAGSPRAARQVGSILMRADFGVVPWWRVLNNAGFISIKGNFEATPTRQKELLQSEGVVVSLDMQVDMAQYRYIPRS